MKTKKKSRFNPVAKHAAKYNKAAVFVPKKFKKEKHTPKHHKDSDISDDIKAFTDMYYFS